MKVFISWSGERSKTIALELRQWLPDVIHNLEPWMSATDIRAGARWAFTLTTELEDTRFGILCLTKENLNEPWILFEAGALAKTVDETFVCPYLIDMSPSEIPNEPLSQFQAKCADVEGTWELLQSLNQALPTGNLSDDRLRRSFNRCWSDLYEKLKNLPKVLPEQPQKETVESAHQSPIYPLIKSITPSYMYLITVGGRASDINEFVRQVRGIDGYLSKTISKPDGDGAVEIKFTFDQKVDRDIINNAAETENLNILVKTMMRLL